MPFPRLDAYHHAMAHQKVGLRHGLCRSLHWRCLCNAATSRLSQPATEPAPLLGAKQQLSPAYATQIHAAASLRLLSMEPSVYGGRGGRSRRRPKVEQERVSIQRSVPLTEK